MLPSKNPCDNCPCDGFCTEYCTHDECCNESMPCSNICDEHAMAVVIGATPRVMARLIERGLA